MAKRRQFEELERGRRHEMEHVDDASFAGIIAEDHLREDPHYYSHLESRVPGGCPSCHTNPTETNPGFVRTAADERLWERAKEAAGRTYQVGSASYWRVVNFVFHKMRATHNASSARSVQRNSSHRNNPDVAPAMRAYLHDIVDELPDAPQRISMDDYAALRRIAHDAGSEVARALLEFHVDPTGFDDRDFIWLLQNLHRQIDQAANFQIMGYVR